MKTKLSLLLIFIFIGSKIESQTLLNETFTGVSLPSGWSIATTATDPYEQWKFYDDYDDIEVNESSTKAQEEWLFLPEQSLQNYSEMYFNFSLWLYNKTSYIKNKSCKTMVMISTDGVNWYEAWSTDILRTEEFNGDALFERLWSVNLTQYCGVGKPNVKIAFRYISNGTKTGTINSNPSFAALLRANISGLPMTSFSNLDKKIINWYPVEGYTGKYDLYYGAFGSTPNKSGGILVSGITGTSYSLPQDYCQYAAFIRANKNDSVGEWQQLNFTNVVDNLVATSDSNSSVISWTGDNDLYDLEYGVGNFTLGSGTRVNNVAETIYNLNSLLPNTIYKIFIKASCNSASWKSLTFTTDNLSTNDISKANINIYPNPVKNILNFSEELSNIKITDGSGRILIQAIMPEKSLDISNLTKGNYIITAFTKDGRLITNKVIKD